MFASLLPGFREIRTPLTVGYAWLAALWLGVGYRVAMPKNSHGVLADVYRIGHAIGPVAAGIVASIGAYLIGVVTTSLTLRTTDLLGNALRRTRFGALTPEQRRRNLVRPVIEQAVVERLAQRYQNDAEFRQEVWSRISAPHPDLAPKSQAWFRRGRRPTDQSELDWDARREVLRQLVDIGGIVDSIESELDYIALRLRGRNDAMYDEYDRLEAEADFRVAMFPPVTAAFGILTGRAHPVWLLGVAAAITLLYVSAGARTKAGRMIGGALAASSIDDEALTRLDSMPVHFVDEAA